MYAEVKLKDIGKWLGDNEIHAERLKILAALIELIYLVECGSFKIFDVYIVICRFWWRVFCRLVRSWTQLQARLLHSAVCKYINCAFDHILTMYYVRYFLSIALFLITRNIFIKSNFVSMILRNLFLFSLVNLINGFLGVPMCSGVITWDSWSFGFVLTLWKWNFVCLLCAYVSQFIIWKDGL